jgi:hypothetical protein
VTVLYVLIPVVLLCTGVTVYTVSSLHKRVEAAINHVETAVHDRANHLVLDAMAAEKKAAEGLNWLRSNVAADLFNLNAAVAKHVTTEIKTVEAAVIEHTKTAIHGAVAATATGIRNAVCSVCNRLSHTWHVIEGKVECKDCEIRRTTN